MRAVHVVLPNDIDDPSSPSGGNVYDRRLCDGLVAAGWTVHEHPVAGSWPTPSTVERAAFGVVLAGLPDDALVVIDGLVASAVPLSPHASRLRLVVLLHLPVGGAAEAAALRAARAVITTSRWCRDRVLSLHALAPWRVHVAEPGVDLAPLAPVSAGGDRLICVGAVSHHKGHDLLVPALASVSSPLWSLSCVGTVTRSPDFVTDLRRGLRAHGLHDRVGFTGPLVGEHLHAAYAAADLLVLPSRGETYGMVVTEALARGIPVLAAAVGGVPEALGHPDAGLLVPPDDAAALAGALRTWLSDVSLRDRLRAAARVRRATLAPWSRTVGEVDGVLNAMGVHSGA
jgi:glycosyltransferase involved in cell wall biosynthesis